MLIHSTNGSTFTELEIVDCVMLLFAIQILKEISNKKKITMEVMRMS